MIAAADGPAAGADRDAGAESGGAPGRRGTLALDAGACTSCMLCVRECPVWCLHLESHQETDPASPPGRRARVVNVLDSFDVDYGVCMYCGICVQVCPFDALAWAAPATPPATSVAALRHDRDALGAVPLPDR